jgi:hypothetical protein
VGPLDQSALTLAIEHPTAESGHEQSVAGAKSALTPPADARPRRAVSRPDGADWLFRGDKGRILPESAPIRARDQLQPQIEICRRHYRGDPRLPVIEISVKLAA